MSRFGMKTRSCLHVLIKTEDAALLFETDLRTGPQTLGSPLTNQVVETRVAAVTAVSTDLHRVFYGDYVPEDSESPQNTISSISSTTSVSNLDSSTDEFRFQRIEHEKFFLPLALSRDMYGWFDGMSIEVPIVNMLPGSVEENQSIGNRRKVEVFVKANADYTVKADAATTLISSWDGWGTSLYVFGDREDIADLLFTTKDAVTLNGSTSSLPALGLTIARYNIGGSANNVVDDSGTEVSMETSDNMPAFKLMETFWLDWMSKDPTSTSWNWDADAKQRAMVGLATQRDVDILEAFSNSPPWWMTNNHATAGGDDGDKDNLEDWNHDQFALYLATVVSHARTS
ncbi:hypothetical protein PC113_g1130 [Phytophthora cactorum]|uniref:Endo-beta-1,6-galactanase-like domain-containing protein n=3 Tax=Phytophthora cactorum TaxID=29920 RepID=A0A8T1DPP7_9STRA|nr:hypothetical protein PC113_g1130 [Phytophthora cactorum]KAG2943335.1 hypothetical protein PC115_g845 [Phytophthora cactorum]